MECDHEERLTVACHIQRVGIPAFPHDPLGFSVDLLDPQDIRRAEKAWEQLAYVIDHVLEEALTKLGLGPCRRCEGRGWTWEGWTDRDGEEQAERVPCEVCQTPRRSLT